MTENVLNVELTDHASVQLSSLGPEDRRRVESWFDHLRNWRSDEFIRSRSRRLEGDADVYVFETRSDIIIAFRIDGDQVTILSIFRAGALRLFETAAARGA